MYRKRVALRKESVDRNYGSDLVYSDGVVSLSARRAWIEIPLFGHCLSDARSLSARRAWIEITSDVSEREPLAGRSPQGERG